MTNGWQTVQLGDILTRVKSELTIDDSVTYKQVTVRLWNKGVILRGEQEGTDIKTKRQFFVKTGQLLMSRIDVRNGAIGLVPKELDGAIVSNDFWVYDFDENQIYPEFLALYVKTPNFIEDADRTSSGTTKRIRAEESRFLEIEIPLPPLTEQRRIAEGIESLAARVNAAQRLREEADSATEKYFASVTSQLFTELSEKYRPIAIGKTFTFRQDLIRPTDGKSGKIRFVGLQHVESNTGRRIGEDTLYAEQLTGRKFHFSPGEIVYGYLRPYLNKVWIADCEGVCSVDQYVIRPNEKIIDTKYLAYFMRSPAFLHKAIEMTHNLLLPRLRTGLLESILIPVPPLDEQRRIVAYLDGLQAKVNALRGLQSQSQEELDALMASVLDRAFKGEL